MKRLHVHIHVDDVEESTRFYTTLFGVPPAVREHDYAKWMLEDPRVNLAISTKCGAKGVDHLGIQVESREALGEIADRLTAAERAIVEQTDAACCYARSDKAWAADPQGVAWETFFTHDGITTYGDDTIATEALPRSRAATP